MRFMGAAPPERDGGPRGAWRPPVQPQGRRARRKIDKRRL